MSARERWDAGYAAMTAFLEAAPAARADDARRARAVDLANELGAVARDLDAMAIRFEDRGGEA
jgi:hypothetical protein